MLFSSSLSLVCSDTYPSLDIFYCLNVIAKSVATSSQNISYSSDTSDHLQYYIIITVLVVTEVCKCHDAYFRTCISSFAIYFQVV